MVLKKDDTHFVLFFSFFSFVLALKTSGLEEITNTK